MTGGCSWLQQGSCDSRRSKGLAALCRIPTLDVIAGTPIFQISTSGLLKMGIIAHEQTLGERGATHE